MTTALLVVAGIGLGVVLALRLYARWFVQSAVNEMPRVQVTHPERLQPGEWSAVLTLRATSRAFSLVRLWMDAEEAERLGIGPPEAFQPATASDDEEPTHKTVAWIPRQNVTLVPGRPMELRGTLVRWEGPPATLHVQAESKLGAGGSAVLFGIVVGERRRREVERLNLRSDLYARAAELGVAPNELPEWRQLSELEARGRRS